MKPTNSDILLLLVAGGVTILIINTRANAGSDLIDSGSSALQTAGQTTGSTVAQVAPWAIGGIVAWGLLLA